MINAQYNQRWMSNTTTNGNRTIIGCENTDDDPAIEVVLLNTYAQTIEVIDGITGTVEWTSSAFVYIEPGIPVSLYGECPTLMPRLVDINSDGKYEIFFYGRTSGAYNRWYVYGYGTISVEETNLNDNFYQELRLAQNYPNPLYINTQIEYVLSKTGNVKINIYKQPVNWLDCLPKALNHQVGILLTGMAPIIMDLKSPLVLIIIN
jgi:hypothetical protein